jgi:hypothetical protein
MESAGEYRTHMSLWSLLLAPLIAGDELRTMTDEAKSILMKREIIAFGQAPDDKPVTQVSAEAGIEVLMRPLHDGSVVAGLFNPRGAQAEAEFARSSLPTTLTDKKIKVRAKHDLVPTRSRRRYPVTERTCTKSALSSSRSLGPQHRPPPLHSTPSIKPAEQA